MKFKMKTNNIHKMRVWAAAFIAALLCTACSDTWNDHYDNNSQASGTLWSAISSNSNISNFKKVIEGCGFDIQLNSNQVYTVFAPTNSALSATVADSLVAAYKAQKSSGVKDEDNTVMTQFVKNHIALYNTSVSSYTNDSISMLNGKYLILTQKKLDKSNILSANEVCSNGILYTIDRTESYFQNIWEYMKMNPDLDSLSNFFYSFNRYIFNASESVPGGIVDGKTVYLDSVSEFENQLLRSYGKINCEDSTYWMLMPTNQVWKALYNEYINYFQYPLTMDKADSLINVETKSAIIRDLCFNYNEQRSINDSLISTSYSKMNYKYDKFLNPFAEGGILNGTQVVDCSNGKAYITNEWRIDKSKSFLTPVTVEAERTFYQVIDGESDNAITPCPIRMVEDTANFKVSGRQYVEISPLENANVSVSYQIPNVLSNMGYDIYCVFVPAIAYDSRATKTDRYPNKVGFQIQYKTATGALVQPQTLKNGTSSTFITKADVVDTLQIASNFQFPSCSYNLSTPTVTLKIASVVTPRETSKYTRVLRLDCIILKQHTDTQTSG